MSVSEINFELVVSNFDKTSQYRKKIKAKKPAKEVKLDGLDEEEPENLKEDDSQNS
jgi:hypothetical protein